MTKTNITYFYSIITIFTSSFFEFWMKNYLYDGKLIYILPTYNKCASSPFCYFILLWKYKEREKHINFKLRKHCLYMKVQNDDLCIKSTNWNVLELVINNYDQTIITQFEKISLGVKSTINICLLFKRKRLIRDGR